MSSRKRSELWSVFTCIDDEQKFAKCDICEQKLSYKTTSNLKKHLIKKHPTVIKFENQKDDSEETVIYNDTIIIEESRLEDKSASTLSIVKNMKQDKIKSIKQPVGTFKGRRKTSALWSIFTPVNENFAQCNICALKFSFKSSISNLRKHLIRKHPTENSNLPKEADEEMSTVYIEHNPFSSSSTSIPGTSTLACQEKNRQTKLSVYNPKKIDKTLMNLFIHDFHPFSIVEDKGFVEFVKALNPTYTLPKKQTISMNMIQPMYEECYNLAQEKLSTVNSFCLTMDYWTSHNVSKYLAITAHYTDDNFKFKSILIGCVLVEPEDTSSNLAEAIQNITDKFDISNKIMIVVTDNEINIKSAITDFLQWEHFGCYVHTLNLIVQKSLENVKEVIDKVQTIVAHFKSSTVARENLLSCQENTGMSTPKKLIQDSNIMWNSTYYMLQRFLELEDALKATLDLLDYDFEQIQQEEWKILRDLCKVLKPFEEITMRISNESEVNVGQLIILTNGLKSVCEKLKKENLHKDVKKVLGDLIADVCEQFADIENNNILATCTFLDPRFKMLGFSDPSAADSIKNHVIQLVTSKIDEGKEVLQNGDIGNKNNSAAKVDELSVFDDFDSRTSALKPKVLVTYADPSDADTVKNYVIEVVTSVINDKRISQAENNDNKMDTSTESDDFSLFQDFDSRTAVLNPKRSTESAATSEIMRYIDEPLLPRNESPLLWWKENRHFYPNLEKIVKEKFCMLATSAPSKKLFSKAGLVISDRISRLKPKHLEKLLFLNCNGYLLEK